MNITGTKTLTLSAEDIAVVLDALAVQPYNKVSRVINIILGQVVDKTEEKEA